MRVIILTQGQHTVVDDDVYEWASKFKWHAKKDGHTFYARRNIRLPDGRRSTRYLHREIVKAALGTEVDHRDHDGLNNLGDNIRTCNHSENRRNCPVSRSNTSGYKGVSLLEGRWRAQIQIGGQTRHLGYFDQAIDAAKEYDRAAIELFGNFAKLNFPKQKPTIAPS